MILNRNGTDHGQYEPYYYRDHANSSKSVQSQSMTYRHSNYLNPYYGVGLNVPQSIQPPTIQSRSIPIYKWPNNDENDSSPNIIPMLSTESQSEPNPAYFQLNVGLNNNQKDKSIQSSSKKSKRRRKNLCDSPATRHHIHPSMNKHKSSISPHHKTKHNKNTSLLSPSHHDNNTQNDSLSSSSKNKLKNSPKNKLEIVAPDMTGNLVDL